MTVSAVSRAMSWEIKKDNGWVWSEYIPTIEVCSRCFKKFVPVKSKDVCTLCLGLPKRNETTYAYRVYRPKKSWTEIISSIRENRRKWKKNNPDKVKKDKREWSSRFYRKNQKKCSNWHKTYYKLKKFALMQAINDRIIVKRITGESKSKSGIILAPDTSNIILGEVKFTPKNPSLEVKKNQKVGYSVCITFTHEGEAYDIINLKDLLVIF